MKIGYPNHPRKDVLEEIKWIGENNFDFIDFYMEEDKCVPGKFDVEKAKQLLKKYNLDIVGHMAYYLAIGSPSKIIRDSAIKQAEEYFKVFKKLGVKYATIHANWAPGFFTLNEAVNFQIDSLKKLVQLAKKYSLKIMYEPIDTEKDTAEILSKILNSVKGLYFHLDIGHANLHGRKPEEFIKRFHKKLVHIHAHDNNGREDQHLPIGAGRIDWENLIKTLKKYYNGTVTLEVFSKDRDYVLASRDKLKRLLKVA